MILLLYILFLNIIFYSLIDKFTLAQFKYTGFFHLTFLRFIHWHIKKDFLSKHVAKNIIATGLAKKYEFQVAYSQFGEQS